MAVDTAVKRHSALVYVAGAPPLPDGTISQADRQTLTGSYSGILAAAPIPPEEPCEPRRGILIECTLRSTTIPECTSRSMAVPACTSR